MIDISQPDALGNVVIVELHIQPRSLGKLVDGIHRTSGVAVDEPDWNIIDRHDVPRTEIAMPKADRRCSQAPTEPVLPDHPFEWLVGPRRSP